jgi:hypothetical protein
MSSSRVAAKPRATNSSMAASTIAARRSAARSARFEGPALAPPVGPRELAALADVEILDAFLMLQI